MTSGQPLRKSRKVESGAQLLARLNSRTDLSCLDPNIFDVSSSQRGQVIEVYGSEGTGKTEMLLHYIAKACLPSHWNGHVLKGLGSKVIFIDTEFKFSVFRLAIVMEKQILSLREKSKQDFSVNELIAQNNVNCASGEVIKTHNEVTIVSEKISADEEKLCQCNLSSDTTDLTERDVTPNISGIIHGHFSGKGAHSSCRHDHREKGEQILSVAEPGLTAQDVEDIVQDALSRVQVFHIHSTDQLLATLLYLEHNLSCDTLISMIVIDTISAFYWTDKLGDMDNHSITDIKMGSITHTISKFVSDFGITFLVTKSALIGKNRNSDREGIKSRCISDVTSRSQMGLCQHVEFLGKSWSSLSKKRLVLTRNVDGMQKEARTAWCTDWAMCKLFSCTDNGFTFV